MRLLQLQAEGALSLVEHVGSNIPRYAILSHTWGADHEEVTFKDLTDGKGKSKEGYRKLAFCRKQAEKDGLQYFWVDTCCIDKSSSAELTEAINSMFRWYQDAARCYVYLSDVSVLAEDDKFSRRWKLAFKRSKWFTRGWTLQELIAPELVEFFSREGQRLGDKQSLVQTLHEITGITIQALQGKPLSYFSVDERMSWAAKRKTKREEDEAYSLLGIFEVSMPSIYGEGRKRALNRLRKQIKEDSEYAPLQPLNEDQQQMLLDSLRFEQMDARHMTIKDSHAETCQWLLKNPEYVEWVNSTKLDEHHGFLWIKGKPGAGKSTLMKFALNNVRTTMKDRIVISFFFNARGDDLEKSTIGAYRSLLLQLFKRLPALKCVLDSLGRSTTNISTSYQWSIELLKNLLKSAIKELKESSVVCFIDALDECDEWQIRDMISFFGYVGELTVSANIKFQVCFASRHYPHITIRKGLNLVLEGQEGHNQDIADYLESELKIVESKDADEIRAEIQEKASGVFMWVVLVVQMLNKEHDRGRLYGLRRRLHKIPGDLNELFRDILTRDSENRHELLLCIQWVLFARQPLRPEQLYHAILSGVEPESLSSWDSDQIPLGVIRRFILDSSKGLAETTKSGIQTVQFIHESVTDFLLKENGLGDIWADLGSSLQGQSHERLKHCCLTYMNIDVFTHLGIPESLPNTSSHQAAVFRQSAADEFPLLKYAVRNVLYHANVAAGCSIDQTGFLRSFPLAKWIKLGNLFEEDETRLHTQDASLLYVLAENNLSNLIKIHPSNLWYLEVENESYGPPLFAALATGSEEAVRTFVELHTATQTPDSLLHNLCSHYRPNKTGRWRFRRNFYFSNRRTVLSYLAALGDNVLFALALETGKFMLDSKDQDELTPLCWAARNGRETIVKWLLETDKVDVNSRDHHGQTPLTWAVRNGYQAVIKLLLETSTVDVDPKDSDGWTPLWHAARKRDEVVIKLLLETGKVDVHSENHNGLTPLTWAVQKEDWPVVALLQSHLTLSQ